jgi:trehalose 6-phosphate phosphatase
MSHAAAPHAAWALFLDVDGTLVDFAATPQSVYVPESLKTLLLSLSEQLDGAVALVSGRSVDSLDQLFAPHRFSAAGVHGCERRTAAGVTLRPEVNARGIARAREQLTAFTVNHSGLLLEDKGYGLALHFRRAPELEAQVHATMTATLDQLGADFQLQAGKLVYELRPANWSKGTSIFAFMQETPFQGRRPIFIGDDVTDEDAFGAVNALDGISVCVGDRPGTSARYRLHSVADVHRWLAAFPPPALASLVAIPGA